MSKIYLKHAKRLWFAKMITALCDPKNSSHIEKPLSFAAQDKFWT